MIEKRKLVLVGTGFVGMSMVYSIVNQGIGVNELVLIDVLKDKAEGEAMDISDGIPCSPSHMIVKSGDYSECSDADIVVITAGLNQKPGQTRLELSEANAKIMKDITTKSGFKFEIDENKLNEWDVFEAIAFLSLRLPCRALLPVLGACLSCSRTPHDGAIDAIID